MIKETDLLDDDLPKPGEPLTVKVHPDNQALIDEELKERAERARARLTFWQRIKLQRRYKALWKHLNQFGWNKLVDARTETMKHYESIRYDYQIAQTALDRKSAAALKNEARLTAQRGQQLDQVIAKLAPYAAEFKSIANRLAAHRQLISFEREDAQNKAAFRVEAKTWEGQLKAAFRQSRRLHHAGYDTKGNYFCRIPRIERIKFHEDRVLYKIKVSHRNLFGKWKSALPYNVDVPDLSSEVTLANLSSFTNRIVTVVRGTAGQDFYYAISRLDSPDGIPKRVLWSKVMPWYPVDDHRKTPWCAGVTNDRKTKWFNFEDANHILIAGSTKSGKSNHINQMIATLVTMNSPRELRLVLVDNKGGIEFTHWKSIKHMAIPMIKTVGEVLPAMRWARRVMERRIVLLESMMVKNLAAYNAKVKEESRLPRLVIIIDEMSTLLDLGNLTTDIQTELRVLSSQGRAAGVHLIVCTQHVTVDVLPGWVKTNMAMRVAGFIPGIHASMAIINSTSAAALPQNVIGRLVFALGREETIAQSPFISDEQVANAVNDANQYADPDNAEFNAADVVESADEPLPVLVPVERFSREDLIKLALADFGGKLSAKRMHEVLTNDVISRRSLENMVKAIVSAGGVEYDGVKYNLKKDRTSYVLTPAPQHHSESEPSDLTEARGAESGVEGITEEIAPPMEGEYVAAAAD